MSKCTRATNVKLNINKEKEMGKVRSIIKKKVTLSKDTRANAQKTTSKK